MDVHQAIEEFFRSLVAAHRRPTTIINYRRIISQYVKHSKITNTDEITVESVRKFLFFMGGKPRSAMTYRAYLLVWLRWLVNEEIIPSVNWRKRIIPVTIDEDPPRALSPEQCIRLLTCIETAENRTTFTGRRNTAMIYLFLDTAMREGELLRLKIDDIDLQQRYCIISSESKGRRLRYVYFSEWTAKAIRAYLRLCPPNINSLFINRFHNGISKSYIYQLVKRAAYTAGIPRATVHALRHTAAKILKKRGMSLVALQKLLGHKNIRTTMIYTDFDSEDVREEYENCAPMMLLKM